MSAPRKTIGKSRKRPPLWTLMRRVEKLQEEIEIHPDTLKDRLRALSRVPHERLVRDLVDTQRLTRFKGTEECDGDVTTYECTVELDGVKYTYKAKYWDRSEVWTETDFDHDRDITFGELVDARVPDNDNDTEAIAWALACLWCQSKNVCTAVL